MNKARVLIVDDDPTISGLVRQILKDAGFWTHHAKSADMAFSYLSNETVDLLLLDINLPGISGLKLLELLKREPKTASLPIIMMTMKSETESKVQSLKGGADEYIVKPFAAPELLARIDALLRRVHHEGKIERVCDFGNLHIDFDRLEVLVKGKQADLTPVEFHILTVLVGKPEHIFSYQSIRETMGEGKDVSSETLYSHVKNLRKKLGPAAEMIETVYGTGYRFKPF